MRRRGEEDQFLREFRTLSEDAGGKGSRMRIPLRRSLAPGAPGLCDECNGWQRDDKASEDKPREHDSTVQSLRGLRELIFDRFEGVERILSPADIHRRQRSRRR